jgi:diadenosine tetraphosphate (Ap4A) HIT family hydrolase
LNSPATTCLLAHTRGSLFPLQSFAAMIALGDRQAKGTAVKSGRVPVDLAAYQRRIRSGACFVCGIVRGDPGCQHEQVVFEDANHIAFLDGYPTLYGKVLVAPKTHVEHVVRELSRQAFLELLAVVHRVAAAVERVVPSERTYLLSLGSQQANAHVHWHIAPLPPGTPFDRQQLHALMLEHGTIPWSATRAAELATRLREALARQ